MKGDTLVLTLSMKLKSKYVHSSGYRLLKKYRYPARETKFTIFGDFRDLSLQKVLNLFKQKFEFDRNLSKNLN